MTLTIFRGRGPAGYEGEIKGGIRCKNDRKVSAGRELYSARAPKQLVGTTRRVLIWGNKLNVTEWGIGDPEGRKGNGRQEGIELYVLKMTVK